MTAEIDGLILKDKQIAVVPLAATETISGKQPHCHQWVTMLYAANGSWLVTFVALIVCQERLIFVG
jgi:hypothetical protein